MAFTRRAFLARSVRSAALSARAALRLLAEQAAPRAPVEAAARSVEA